MLDLPKRLYAEDQRLTVVCFDEVQDLLGAGRGLDGLLRSVIQHHGDAAAYVYAGSAPSLMRELFDDRERPLYGQARPLELGPLPLDETLTDVSGLFRSDGRHINKVGDGWRLIDPLLALWIRRATT